MSKNLLGSARKIRARLQPALVKESRAGDHQNYNRLLFLDQTLQNMIRRFEDEFPETRLTSSVASPPVSTPERASLTEASDPSPMSDTHAFDTEAVVEPPLSDDEGDLRPALSRHNSDVSLASRALSQEEGRMHKFGQKIRRDILKPETEDHVHGTTGQEIHPEHLKLLRSMVEDLQGEEIRSRIETHGQDAVIAELSNDASFLRKKLMEDDPEGWQKFKESQEVAQRNSSVAGLGINTSAVE